MTDEEEKTPWWIEWLTKLSMLVGMNPTQARWRLIRWNQRRKLPKSERPMVWKQLGVGAPEAFSLSTLVSLLIMASFARVWIAQGGGFSSPPPWLLFDFGGRWTEGANEGEQWRLVTSIFIHAGFMHIAFNLISLAVIGPQVEAIYGRFTMLFLLIVTGVISGYVSSEIKTDAVGIGASGGICGLIGAAAGYGHHLGTAYGKQLRNDMLKWLAYVIVFGFMVAADNTAHAVGAVTGGLFGYLVSPRVWKKPALKPLRIVCAVVASAAAIGAIVIIMTRHPEHTDGKVYPLTGVICAITRC
jgi:rhomboid protease GluP